MMADKDPANRDSPHRDSDKSGESPGTSSEALVEEIMQKVLATIKKKSSTFQDKIPPMRDSASRDDSRGVDAGTPGTLWAEALADEITRKVLMAIQKKTSTPQGEEFPPGYTQQGCDRSAGVFCWRCQQAGPYCSPFGRGNIHCRLVHHYQGQAPHRALHSLTPGAYVTVSWAH